MSSPTALIWAFQPRHPPRHREAQLNSFKSNLNLLSALKIKGKERVERNKKKQTTTRRNSPDEQLGVFLLGTSTLMNVKIVWVLPQWIHIAGEVGSHWKVWKLKRKFTKMYLQNLKKKKTSIQKYTGNEYKTSTNNRADLVSIRMLLSEQWSKFELADS